MPRDNGQKAALQIAKWWKHCSENNTGHWDLIGYKQGLRDCLEILKKHKVIKNYSLGDIETEV